ncbi:S8 family serine peptidase [Mycoplasma sp. BRA285]
MKKTFKKIFSILTLSSVVGISIPISMSASLSNDVKINKYTNTTISLEQLNSYKNIYSYFFKLHNISKQEDLNFDLNESYSKVGIIEVNGIKKSDIINTKINSHNFHVHGDFISEYSNTNTMHGSKVYSLIGSDLGVNNNANVYYSSLDMINSIKNDSEKQNIFNKYPDINQNIYSKIKNSLDYMVANDVKIVNLSLGPKLLSYSQDKNIDFEVLNSIENNFINTQNFIAKDNTYPEIAETYWLLNISKILNLDLNSGSKLDEILDFYNKKYGISVIAAAGNDGEIYSNITKYIQKLKKYKSLDSLINSIKWQIKSSWRSNDLNEWIHLNNLLDVVNANKNSLSHIITSVNKDDNLAKNVISKYNKFIENTIGNNVVYVASVNDSMKPSKFSTFAMSENDNLPFVSSYGEAPKLNSDETLKEKSSDSKLNSLINYYLTSEGTSFSAPIITGMISLLQQSLNRTFSMAEIKALLAYSSQIKEYNLNTYTNSDYDEVYYIKNDFNYGVRRKNNSFSKIGFGVPDYRKMYQIVKNGQLKKFKIDFNSINDKTFTYKIPENEYEYNNSSRYSIVLSYDKINPVNDKKGFLWYLSNKNDESGKYFDFLIYCSKNIKDFDILNLKAEFDYTVYYQNWFDYYNYYPEEISRSKKSISNSNTSSVEKIWIDMPVYERDNAIFMDDYSVYISIVFLNELYRIYSDYKNQNDYLDDIITWEECKNIFIEYINSLDITYIIGTDYFIAKRG